MELLALKPSLLMQEIVKDFLDKKEKNQLLIQRSTNLLKTLLKPVSILKHL